MRFHKNKLCIHFCSPYLVLTMAVKKAKLYNKGNIHAHIPVTVIFSAILVLKILYFFIFRNYLVLKENFICLGC